MIWDLQNKKPAKTLQNKGWTSQASTPAITQLNPLIDQAGKIMVIFPGNTFSGIENQNTPEIWSLESGELLHTLPTRTSTQKMQTLSKDGNLLAYEDKNQLLLYHLPSQRYLFKKSLSEKPKPLSFSYDNRYLYLANLKQGIQILDINEQKITQNLQGHFSLNQRSEYSPEAGILIQMGLDWIQDIDKPYIQIWNMRQGTRSFVVTNKTNPNPPDDFKLSKDGKTLAVLNRHKIATSENGYELNLYTLQNGIPQKLRTLTFPYLAQSRFIKEQGLSKKLWEFSSNGKFIYFAENLYPPSPNQKVIIKRLDLQSEKIETLIPLSALESFHISPQEDLLIAEEQRKTQFWSLQNKTLLHENQFNGPTNSYRFISHQAFSPDGKFYILNSISHPTEIWSLKDLKKIQTLTPAMFFTSKEQAQLPLNHIYKSLFSPDGKYLVTFYPAKPDMITNGTTQLGIAIWRTSDWHLIANKEVPSFWGLPPGISFNNENQIWAYTPSEILEWNSKTDAITRFYLTGSAQGWVLATDQGYYRASQNGVDMFAFHVGEHAFPFEQFDLNFNRPDKILEALNAPKDEIQLHHQVWQKRLRRLNIREEWLKPSFHLPELTLLTEQIPPATSEPRLKLKVLAKDSDFTLDRLMVYDNDVPIHGRKGLSLNAENLHSLEQEIEIPLVPGTNKIQVSVLNRAGTESLRETVSIHFTGQTASPVLHLITVGVSDYRQKNFNLRYAAKDAQDIHNYFKTKTTLKYELRPTQLLNRQVSREAVLKLRKQLEQSRPQDRVILFFAGHGLLDQEKNYYFAPHEIDFDHPEKQGLRFEEIEDLLDGIPAREKLLLIDTCNAGELDKELQAEQISFTQPQGQVKARAIRGFKITQHLGMNKLNQLLEESFLDLRRDTGATIITSSQGLEYALESAQWKNGVFTFALLDGLKSRKADLNADGEVRVSELKSYIIQKVQELTRSAQTPNFRRVNLNNDFTF